LNYDKRILKQQLNLIKSVKKPYFFILLFEIIVDFIKICKMKYKDIIRNKKLTSFPRIKPCVISNAMTNGERVKDLEKKKSSENESLSGF